MCDVCRQSPCDPRCPNAPNPPAVYTCKCCDEAVVAGDEFVELDGSYYHAECFMDNAANILFEEYGATKGIAEAER